MTPQNTFGQPISQAGGSVVPNYTAPQTITSAHLAPQSPIQLPPPPNPTNPLPMNASVPSPIPSAASIVGQEGQTTPGEQQQSSILNNIAQLMGGNTSLATLQTTQENGAGVPALTKSVNDLNTQLQGLNNQSTSLALASGAGGTIQNSNENAAVGRMSTAGLQGQEAIDLRTNQIQQAAVAAQSLTVKSALYGAQGNLTLAKDAADKAAQVQYDAQQQQIDHQKAQLAAIQPTLTKEQKVQADTVQAQLQDRQDQIAQAKTDMATGIAMATAAIKNNPNDPQAQYAAQQALQAAQQQPPDLQKIFGLVGKYQTDPIATQTAIQQLQNARLTSQKTAIDIKTAQQGLQSAEANNVDIPTTIGNISNPNQPSAELGGLTVNGLTQKSKIYMTNGGNIQGLGLSSKGPAATQRTLIMNYAGYLASQLGTDIPTITAAYKANSKAAGQVIERAAKIDTTSQTLQSQFPRLQQLASSVGNLGIQESDLTAGKAAAFRKAGNVDAANYIELIQTVRGDYASMQASVAGSKGGQFFAQSAQDAIPLGLTPEQYAGIGHTIQQSAQNAMQASGQEAINLVGNTSPAAVGGGSTIQSNGQTYTVGQVYNDGTANWTVDANGKWTKQ